LPKLLIGKVRLSCLIADTLNGYLNASQIPVADFSAISVGKTNVYRTNNAIKLSLVLTDVYNQSAVSHWLETVVWRVNDTVLEETLHSRDTHVTCTQPGIVIITADVNVTFSFATDVVFHSCYTPLCIIPY
jgi:hypothetical protein